MLGTKDVLWGFLCASSENFLVEELYKRYCRYSLSLETLMNRLGSEQPVGNIPVCCRGGWTRNQNQKFRNPFQPKLLWSCECEMAAYVKFKARLLSSPVEGRNKEGDMKEINYFLPLWTLVKMRVLEEMEQLWAVPPWSSLLLFSTATWNTKSAVLCLFPNFSIVQVIVTPLSLIFYLCWPWKTAKELRIFTYYLS